MNNVFKIAAALAFLMLFSLKSMAINTSPVADGDDEVYIIVEEMPVFPGGDEALRNFVTNNVNYPEEASKQKLHGRVYVCFVIDKDGSVVNVRVARSLNPLLDAEAIRVVKAMPKWTPGKHKGQHVKVSYTLPINFSLK